ncbi:MAG TPA: response regulator transcription factor [Solirubrobacterales bacterium]|nr:response regulator transcription factor [Solirubrobacterales bacterium]
MKDVLVVAGIEVVLAVDGRAGLRAFYEEQPDVIALDLELRDGDGLKVLAKIRELGDVPVVVVTGRDHGGRERVQALRAGADDCVTRPIGWREMLARIEALLRRPRTDALRSPILTDEFVHVDHTQHRVEVLGVEVHLTPTEFRMLATFAAHPGRVLSHSQILEMVWGHGVRERNEVKLYVSYLRRKLRDAAAVDPVETVRGVGYRYQPRKFS